MSEAAIYIFIGLIALGGAYIGVLLSRRLNPRLGLAVPDGSGSTARKAVVAVLLVGVIWIITWLQTGFQDPFDFGIPAIFSLIVLVVVFRGIKKR